MESTSNLVICCAGVGSRLGLNVPKCLAPLLGRPLIHWQLDLIRGFENVTIVTGYKAAEVMRTVRDVRPGVRFVINHDYLTTTTLDSLVMGVADMDDPFVYLDGDLLVTAESISRMQAAPCPAIGIKETYSDQPVCVEMGSGDQAEQVVGFTRETRKYEWTGLAKLSPTDVRKTAGKTYVYHVLEQAIPVHAVEIDCVEIDTQQDYEGAQAWMRDQFAYISSGRIAAAG